MSATGTTGQSEPLDLPRTAGPYHVLAAWPSVRAPFGALPDPLAAAEERLNLESSAAQLHEWGQLRDAVGDELMCTAAVNKLMKVVLDSRRLVPHRDRWPVALVPQPSVVPGDLAAMRALVLLVEAGGCSRLQELRSATLRSGGPAAATAAAAEPIGPAPRPKSTHRGSPQGTTMTAALGGGAPRSLRCLGCAGLVPDVAGPTHRTPRDSAAGSWR